MKTFDGKSYHFPGTCTYQLAGDCVDDTFFIQAYTGETCTPNPDEPCHRNVRLFLDEMTVTLEENYVVKMNAAVVKLPYSVSMLMIRKVSNYVIVSGWNDLIILWDGHASIYITMPTKYANMTCGLCGNYNNDAYDDLMLPDGSQANSLATFGNSWVRTRLGESCQAVHDNDLLSPYTNELNAQDKSDVDEVCEELLYHANFSCSVAKHFYIDQCKKDVSACYHAAGCNASSLQPCSKSVYSDCACTIFTEYSRECARKLDGSSEVLDWRNAQRCRKF